VTKFTCRKTQNCSTFKTTQGRAAARLKTLPPFFCARHRTRARCLPVGVGAVNGVSGCCSCPSKIALRRPWAIRKGEPPALPGSGGVTFTEVASDLCSSIHLAKALQAERRRHGTPNERWFRAPHATTPGNEDRFLGTPVKRGANNHCACGAVEFGASLINKVDSCNCPVPYPRAIGCS